LFCHHMVAATWLMSLLVIFEAKHKIWYSYVVQLRTLPTVTQFHTLKKQTTAVMPLEVMKQQNYFCNDIISGANLRDRNFPHAAIPINYNSKFLFIIPTNFGNFLKQQHISFH
jgi:hypothetical protein